MDTLVRYSMDHNTAAASAANNNGDEAEDQTSHLQEAVDDVDLESATEEDPLTLDPSTFVPPLKNFSPLPKHTLELRRGS